MIEKNLRAEIEFKLRKIQKHPENYAQRQEQIKKSLISLGNIYSFWIENPDLRSRYLLSEKKPRSLKKQARKGVVALMSGWDFLSEFNNESFIDKFSLDDLTRLNKVITQMKDFHKGIRKGRVTLGMRDYTPPSPQRVEEKTLEAIGRTKELYLTDPLEAGIFANLSLSLIQPYDSHNKRTSRLFQNRILDSAGFPVPVIPAGEAKFYLDLLTRTAPNFRDGNDNGQRQFYDFIASKVNVALDDILDDLKIR